MPTQVLAPLANACNSYVYMAVRFNSLRCFRYLVEALRQVNNGEVQNPDIVLRLAIRCRRIEVIEEMVRSFGALLTDDVLDEAENQPDTVQSAIANLLLEQVSRPRSRSSACHG